MKNRIYFLDNLRTFLIFLVVVLHAGLVYEPVLKNTWIVVDPDQNNSIGLIRMYLDLFIMFILFFISGYFIPYSVKSRSTWGFLKSKFRRIMVPWFIAVITLIPAYKMIFLFSRGLPQEEWYTYFHIFQRAGSDLSSFANNPAQNWLWFLPVLFLFQVIYMAMSKTRLLDFNISLRTGVILTFIIGLIYSLIISFASLGGWYHSALLHFQNERLLIYFMAFLLGTLCYKLKVFDSDKKDRKLFILSNIVLTISLTIFTAVALNLFFNMVEPGRNYYFVSETTDRITYHVTVLLSMLSFLHVLVHTFRFNINRSNNLMNNLNSYSYSVYIIHLIVLGVIALVLLKINIPAYGKFLILTVLTYVLSNMIIYTYQKTIQKTVNMKTIATIAIVIVFLGVGFHRGGEKNLKEKEPAMQEQVTGESRISIHEAALTGNLEVIKQYIETGSDLDVREPSGGSSPLITASVFGKTGVALALIEAGADLNLKNNDGSTPLHTAAFFCRPEIVRALLENGADPSIRNNAGSTALESVMAPYDAVKGIYDYFIATLGPMGLELDHEELKSLRPVIAEILQ